MKEFKHIKTGEKAILIEGHLDFYSTSLGEVIPKRFIEDSCDWGEVVKKDYEILSYKHIISGASVAPQDCNKTIEGYLNHKSFKINSVRRLSDGEIFSIGDIIANRCNSEQKISELYINKNDGKCVFIQAQHVDLQYIL